MEPVVRRGSLVRAWMKAGGLLFIGEHFSRWWLIVEEGRAPVVVLPRWARLPSQQEPLMAEAIACFARRRLGDIGYVRRVARLVADEIQGRPSCVA